MSSLLQTILNIEGPKNPLRTIVLTVEATGDDYWAQIILDNYQYDTVDYSVSFKDIAHDEEISSCNVDNVVLTQSSQQKTCTIQVYRDSVISGNIMAVLGINVLSSVGEPVAGASVYANGEFIGMTNSGTFGTTGYLKKFVVAKDYNIYADDGTLMGEQDLTLV